MRLAFIVADPRRVQASFATAHIAHAALRRGHDVGFVGVDDLTLSPGNEVLAHVLRPAVSPATREELVGALAAADAEVEDERLSAWDVVFLRYNPHRSGQPPGNPAVEFGWRLRLGGVLVVNDPEGVQRAGGRMYLSGLPPAIRPRTLITRDPARVKSFLRVLDASAVIRPLNERGGEAEETFYVARGQVKNLNQIITVVRKTGYLVVQEYLPEGQTGEKRLLLLGGEPFRDGKAPLVYRRVRDQVIGGDTVRRTAEFGPGEQRLVDLLRPKLISDGLYFVSVDVAGERVLEINVYTPGGMDGLLSLYGVDAGAAVVRDLERRVDVRRAYRRTPWLVA